MPLIDTSTEFGARVARRLADEQVIWLTTVSPAGRPQPSPVWFLWTGSQFVIASQRDKPKLRNIAANPRVSLHFNSAVGGGDVVVFAGSAAADPAGLTPGELTDFDVKYTAGYASIGTTDTGFHAEYSEILRVTPDRLRGF